VLVVLLLGVVWWMPRSGKDVTPAIAEAAPLPKAPPATAAPAPSPTPSAPAPAEVAAPVPAPVAAMPDAAVADHDVTDAPSAAKDRAKEARHRMGRVRISVAPWGKVWVDGKYMGRAPVNARLPAGPHEVGGGYEQPTAKRTVTLRSGENPPVLLELPTQ